MKQLTLFVLISSQCFGSKYFWSGVDEKKFLENQAKKLKEKQEYLDKLYNKKVCFMDPNVKYGSKMSDLTTFKGEEMTLSQAINKHNMLCEKNILEYEKSIAKDVNEGLDFQASLIVKRERYRKLDQCIDQASTHRHFSCIQREFKSKKKYNTCYYEAEDLRVMSLKKSQNFDQKQYDKLKICKHEAMKERDEIFQDEKCIGYSPILRGFQVSLNYDLFNSFKVKEFDENLFNCFNKAMNKLIYEKDGKKYLSTQDEKKYLSLKEKFEQQLIKQTEEVLVMSCQAYGINKSSKPRGANSFRVCRYDKGTGPYNGRAGNYIFRDTYNKVTKDTLFVTDRIQKLLKQDYVKKEFNRGIVLKRFPISDPNINLDFESLDNNDKKLSIKQRIYPAITKDGNLIDFYTRIESFYGFEYFPDVIPFLNGQGRAEWRDEARGQIKWAKIEKKVVDKILTYVNTKKGKLEDFLTFNFVYKRKESRLYIEINDWSKASGTKAISTLILKAGDKVEGHIVYELEREMKKNGSEHFLQENEQARNIKKEQENVLKKEDHKENNVEELKVVNNKEEGKPFNIDKNLTSQFKSNVNVIEENYINVAYLNFKNKCFEGKTGKLVNDIIYMKEEAYRDMINALEDINCKVDNGEGCNNPKAPKIIWNLRKELSNIDQIKAQKTKKIENSNINTCIKINKL